MTKCKLNLVAVGVLALLGASQSMAQVPTLSGPSSVVVSGNDDSSNHGSEGALVTSNSGEGAVVPNQAYLEVLTNGTATLSGTSGVNINGTTTVTGTTTIKGTTLINTGSSEATTSIGSAGNTGAVSITSGAANIQVVDGAISLTGPTEVSGTLKVTGQSTTNGLGNTGTLSNTGTLVQTGTANINVDAAANTNIGTGNAASTTRIGNANAGATVSATGGNSSLSLANGTARLASGSNSGFTAYSAAKSIGSESVVLSNGNAASQALVSGASVYNVIKGNTLVDGNMYINGSLVYSSNQSAATTVTGDKTVGGMSVVNAGQSGVVVDANGKMDAGQPTSEATAALTVKNTAGNTHGIVVQESKTTISGGNTSSSLTLDDRGATFSESATGAPVTVTGVADGRADFDAVNVRQFGHAIAAVAASANIPLPQAGKDVAVGVGMGHFMGKTALALGLNYRFSPSGVFRASVSSGVGAGSKAVVGMGAGWSW